MLVWRAFSLPANRLRQNVLISSRRSFHKSPAPHYYPRPTGLGPRIWFKPDGTPRSKIKGLIFGTITFTTLGLMYTMLDMIQDLDSVNYLISCLVHIQRTDFEYTTIDFTDASKTLEYFRELCSSFKDVPQDLMDDFFGDMVTLVATHGEAKEAAHLIMKGHCDRVHEVLKQSRGQPVGNTAVDVVLLLDQALIELLALVARDSTSDKSERNMRILEEKSRDTASKRHDSDYEVIG